MNLVNRCNGPMNTNCFDSDHQLRDHIPSLSRKQRVVFGADRVLYFKPTLEPAKLRTASKEVLTSWCRWESSTTTTTRSIEGGSRAMICPPTKPQWHPDEVEATYGRMKQDRPSRLVVQRRGSVFPGRQPERRTEQPSSWCTAVYNDHDI